MPHVTSNPSLTALTEWWEGMGVDVDHALLDKIAASLQAPTHTSTAAATAPTSAPHSTTDAPAPKRRQKSFKQDDWVIQAREIANGCSTIEEVKAAIESFEGCDLKALSQKTVVYDGTLGAPIMIIGEGPGGQEDIKGVPFAGKAGELLDKMLTAINASRETNTFITNVNFWRPPGNRNPEQEELDVCRPFVDRLVELNQPKIIIATGGVAAKALLHTKTGIMRLRGSEHTFETPGGASVPMIPTLHPAYLLRRPQDKSRAWRDLLLVEQRLQEAGIAL